MNFSNLLSDLLKEKVPVYDLTIFKKTFKETGLVLGSVASLCSVYHGLDLIPDSFWSSDFSYPKFVSKAIAGLLAGVSFFVYGFVFKTSYSCLVKEYNHFSKSYAFLKSEEEEYLKRILAADDPSDYSRLCNELIGEFNSLRNRRIKLVNDYERSLH